MNNKTTTEKGQCFLRSSFLMFSVFLFTRNKIKTPLKFLVITEKQNLLFYFQNLLGLYFLKNLRKCLHRNFFCYNFAYRNSRFIAIFYQLIHSHLLLTFHSFPPCSFVLLNYVFSGIICQGLWLSGLLSPL